MSQHNGRGGARSDAYPLCHHSLTVANKLHSSSRLFCGFPSDMKLALNLLSG